MACKVVIIGVNNTMAAALFVALSRAVAVDVRGIVNPDFSSDPFGRLYRGGAVHPQAAAALDTANPAVDVPPDSRAEQAAVASLVAWADVVVVGPKSEDLLARLARIRWVAPVVADKPVLVLSKGFVSRAARVETIPEALLDKIPHLALAYGFTPARLFLEDPACCGRIALAMAQPQAGLAAALTGPVLTWEETPAIWAAAVIAAVKNIASVYLGVQAVLQDAATYAQTRTAVFQQVCQLAAVYQAQMGGGAMDLQETSPLIEDLHHSCTGKTRNSMLGRTIGQAIRAGSLINEAMPPLEGLTALAHLTGFLNGHRIDRHRVSRLLETADFLNRVTAVGRTA